MWPGTSWSHGWVFSGEEDGERIKGGGMSALKEREQFSESGNSWYGGHGRLCNHPHL